ncbi:glycosyltransferase family 39 protein [Patescibacteria group bacterium]|nr:glycosyltransferase family 39 protein [Patescibacteria group bacterium]
MFSKLRFPVKGIVPLLLLLLSFFTRFVGLNWGAPFFFHPDENNMASALSQLSFTNFNPHFFAYGQFPLYLGFITLKIFNLPNDFSNSIYVLRFWSAVFSVGTVILSYLLARKLFPKTAWLLPLLLIFSPGLIQLAHFGTTETLLIFVFLANIYLAVLYLSTQNRAILFLAALLCGLGIASKITAVFFILPFLLALLFARKKPLVLIPLYLVLTSIFVFLFSPYNLIDFSDFMGAINYETGVATGATPVFYTRQFLTSTPYLFQFVKIFPYALGLPLTVIFLVALAYFIIRRSIKITPQSLVIIIPSLIYFLYNGWLFTKWFRFMSPLFIIPPIFIAYFLDRIFRRRHWIVTILCLFLILPGVYFLNLYLHPDVRLSASEWLKNNLPSSTNVLSEAGNVVNLPTSPVSFTVNNFDFYNLDENPELPNRLIQSLAESNYILIPSRRIFKDQNGPNFPYASRYYQALFTGKLGFTLLKTFTPQTELFLDGENAEETYTVFDHPTIRLYQKTIPHSISDYQQIINSSP